MKKFDLVFIFFIIILLVFLAVIFTVVYCIRNLVRKFSVRDTGALESVVRDLILDPKKLDAFLSDEKELSLPGGKERENLDRLLQKDPFFSEEEMLRRGAVLFGQTQSALEQADWRILQDFMDDGMFQDYYGRIERIKREGNKYVFRQQEPPVVRIEAFREEGEGEYLNLLLKAHLRHYFVEGRTGKLLAGESMRAEIRWFRMIFFRPLGKKTLSRKTSSINCPNCGSPNSFALRGICEYCGSVIKNANHDWILTSLVPLPKMVDANKNS